MELIPAIDLMNGKCVRLFKGDFNKRKDFSKEPHEQARHWEKEGAKCIHIVDLETHCHVHPLVVHCLQRVYLLIYHVIDAYLRFPARLLRGHWKVVRLIHCVLILRFLEKTMS